jgi:hypothetical protein
MEIETPEIDTSLIADPYKQRPAWSDQGLLHVLQYANLTLGMKIKITKSICPYPFGGASLAVHSMTSEGGCAAA